MKRINTLRITFFVFTLIASFVILFSGKSLDSNCKGLMESCYKNRKNTIAPGGMIWENLSRQFF